MPPGGEQREEVPRVGETFKNRLGLYRYELKKINEMPMIRAKTFGLLVRLYECAGGE
jgi:hypothetical protein